MTKGELVELIDKGYITDVSVAAPILKNYDPTTDADAELTTEEADLVYHAIYQVAKASTMDDPHTPENDVHERAAEAAIEADEVPLTDGDPNNDIEFQYIKGDAEPESYTYQGDTDIKAVTALKSLGLKGKFFIGETQLKDELVDVLADATVADHAITPEVTE